MASQLLGLDYSPSPFAQDSHAQQPQHPELRLSEQANML